MGSLFPRLGQPDSSAKPNPQPAATSGSLFGSIANNATGQSAGTPSLFGNTGTATSQPANSGASLFGNTQTSSAGPSNLFGNTGNATSQPANSGASLFGNPQIASTAPSQTQPDPNGSVFGTNILPSQDQTTSFVDRAYDASTAPAQPAYFQALLDKQGNKRLADDGGRLPQLQYSLHDISRKVRNLGQGGPSAGLASVGAGSSRAAYVLGASGINLSQSLRDIESLASTTAAQVQPADEMADFAASGGVKDFLGQHHRSNFEKLIEDRLQQAQTDFNEMIDDQLRDVDWHAHRQRIYEHFGLKRPSRLDDAADNPALRQSGPFGRSSRRANLNGRGTLNQSYGLPGLSKSVIGTPAARGGRQSTFGDVSEKLPLEGIRSAPEDRIQRKKQDDYAAKIKDLNIARVREKVFPIMTRFAEVEAEPSNEDTSMLVNTYKALVYITNEDSSKESMSDPGAVKERQYAVDYLDDAPHSKGNMSVRKRIINGSRAFLEAQFCGQLEATVAKNPREASVGGIPTPIAKVKGYVKVRAARKELGPDVELLQELNGHYCWAVLFYCLRSGLYREALQYIEDNASAFKQIDRNFPRYLKAYTNSDDHRLPSDMQRAIDNEYSTRMRIAPEDSLDPYRMICYKIVGRCDVNRRNLDGITNDMMDWLWLQFALAREYSRVDEYAHEAFGLEELRASIKQIGERYFGPGSDIANAPTTFFFMQVLAGMFEKAVADLYPHNYVSATHFAIALDYYGLLRVSGDPSNDDLLTYTTRQQPQIAFGSMVGLYTRDFRIANATAAVDYLCLICLNADLTGEIGNAQRELCYQALIEVTLETREYAQLLGDIRSDGQRIKGSIEQRLKLIKLDNEHEFMRHITLVAARTAEDQSRTTDAALLYHLAEDYDKVIEIVNEAVSQALTTELGDEPARLTPLKPRDPRQEEQDETLGSSLSLTAIDDPFTLARNMAQLYSRNNMYMQKIKQKNIDACTVLLSLADARAAFAKGKWAECIDVSDKSNRPNPLSLRHRRTNNLFTVHHRLPRLADRSKGRHDGDPGARTIFRAHATGAQPYNRSRHAVGGHFVYQQCREAAAGGV